MREKWLSLFLRLLLYATETRCGPPPHWLVMRLWAILRLIIGSLRAKFVQHQQQAGVQLLTRYQGWLKTTSCYMQRIMMFQNELISFTSNGVVSDLCCYFCESVECLWFWHIITTHWARNNIIHVDVDRLDAVGVFMRIACRLYSSHTL